MPEAPFQPDLPEIPNKLYFRIGEVARLLNVEAHTLRFWEGEFPQLKVGKGGTGQRLYRRRDVELACRIRHLLYNEGYTIPGARQLMVGESRRGRSAAAEPVVQPGDKQRAALQQLRAGLQDLSAMLAERDPAPVGELSAAPERPAEKAVNPARRGLFLASRTSGSATQERTSTPDLFGQVSD